MSTNKEIIIIDVLCRHLYVMLFTKMFEYEHALSDLKIHT